ncbi:hypothetical protein ACFX1T_022511 [Malus domestica]
MAENGHKLQQQQLEESIKLMTTAVLPFILHFNSNPLKEEYPGSSSSQSGLDFDSMVMMIPPPFLNKTYDMVDDPDSNRVVSWSREGGNFVVWDPYILVMSLLPKYFKHNNFSSFVRQLNTFAPFEEDQFQLSGSSNAGGELGFSSPNLDHHSAEFRFLDLGGTGPVEFDSDEWMDGIICGEDSMDSSNLPSACNMWQGSNPGFDLYGTDSFRPHCLSRLSNPCSLPLNLNRVIFFETQNQLLAMTRLFVYGTGSHVLVFQC